MKHLTKILMITLAMINCSCTINCMDSHHESLLQETAKWIHHAHSVSCEELKLHAQKVAPALVGMKNVHGFICLLGMIETNINDHLEILLEAWHNKIEIHDCCDYYHRSIWDRVLSCSIMHGGSVYRTARRLFSDRININTQHGSGNTDLIRVLQWCIPIGYEQEIIHFESPLNEILTDFYHHISREHEEKLLKFCCEKKEDSVPQDRVRCRIAKVIGSYFPRKINLDKQRLNKLCTLYFNFATPEQKTIDRPMEKWS